MAGLKATIDTMVPAVDLHAAKDEIAALGDQLSSTNSALDNKTKEAEDLTADLGRVNDLHAEKTKEAEQLTDEVAGLKATIDTMVPAVDLDLAQRQISSLASDK